MLNAKEPYNVHLNSFMADKTTLFCFLCFFILIQLFLNLLLIIKNDSVWPITNSYFLSFTVFPSFLFYPDPTWFLANSAIFNITAYY